MYIQDAISNPLKIDNVRIDDLGRPSIRYIGRSATVNINPETGNITTVWKTGSKAINRFTK